MITFVTRLLFFFGRRENLLVLSLLVLVFSYRKEREREREERVRFLHGE